MVLASAGPTPFSSHRLWTLFLSSFLGRGRIQPVISLTSLSVWFFRRLLEEATELLKKDQGI